MPDSPAPLTPESVRALAAELMAQHLGPGWRFAFDSALRRAGACHYADSRITVSKHLLAGGDLDEVRQVLLHEIAHALVGHAAAHGPAWSATARRIGYRGRRTHGREIAADRATWLGTCPAGHEHRRFRRPSGVHSCARCSKRFSRAAIITWHRADAPAHGGGTTPGRAAAAGS